MAANFLALSYKQKLWWSEFIYLFILTVIVPFCFGLQIFDQYSHTLSYVFINMGSIPVFILFYRGYLEKILFKGKWLYSILLFPFYLLVYELYSRLFSYLTIHYFTFIPQSYRYNLDKGHPEKFDHIHQAFGYTLLILLTISALSVIRVFFEKENELHTLRYAQIQLELENLRSQVQPHFFFNTLNNLYNLSIQGSEKAPQMIASLSAIMRYVIYQNQEKVPLSKEIDFMQNYFELERIRHTDANLIDFNIQGDPEGIYIAPLLFLPLIENCFKHALQRDFLENPVKIVLMIDKDELVFQTSNKIIEGGSAAATTTIVTGMGISVTKNDDNIERTAKKEQGGIGLSNVRKRLELLYGNRHQFDITRETDNYIVTISIQL